MKSLGLLYHLVSRKGQNFKVVDNRFAVIHFQLSENWGTVADTISDYDCKVSTKIDIMDRRRLTSPHVMLVMEAERQKSNEM